jgi:restriction system protein
MALWLVRAGKRGEHEAKFLADSCVYLTWEKDLGDLAKAKDQKAIIDQILAAYPERGDKTAANQASQVWPFAKAMQTGDWVVTPSKFQPTLHVGEITGGYVHLPGGPAPYYHARKVKWLVTDLPRAAVGQDLLYSLGAFGPCRNRTHRRARRRLGRARA